MATINIYPGAPNTGTEYDSLCADAYEAMDGGNTENTVLFAGGYTYGPDSATSRWWGRDQRYGMDKRINCQIVGDGPVVLNGLVYVDAGTSCTYTGGNIWRIDLIEDANATALADTDEVYFGATYSAAASDVEVGWRRPPAATLGDVSGDGLTAAGMLAGKGVWFARKTGDMLELHVWCPDADAARPETQWGGIAVGVRSAGGAGIVGGTPYNGPFVFKPTASNDPSGSRVTGDFRLLGAQQAHIGSPSNNRSDAYSTMSDIIYSGITMLGRGRVLLESGQSGTVISDITLTGGWTHDDRIDPTMYQATTDNQGRFETVAFAFRVRDCTLEDGAIIVGLSHSALSLSPLDASGTFDGTGTEESRTENCVFRRLRLAARTNNSQGTYCRPFEIRMAYGYRIEQCSMTGFSVPSKINGSGTVVYGNSLSLAGACEPTVSDDNGEDVLVMTALDGAVADAALSCRLYCNTIDRRGDASRGVVNPYAAISLKAFALDTIPAGALDAQCNVILCDAGTAAVRIKTSDDGTPANIGIVERDQTWINNLCSGDEAREALDTEAIGTLLTFEDLFSTGTVAGNVSDTAANILARGDLPARALAIGIAG